jgi:II/X family phage/plasmid replication protein
MLIDWLTLRHPLNEKLGQEVMNRIISSLGMMTMSDSEGRIQWQKAVPDWESIRSDSCGLYWSVTGDADGERYLTIGASPSSLQNQGVNVFGSMDLEHCSNVLIHTAGKALDAILPHWRQWQCRRMDVTANYDMGSSAQVKQSLRLLLATDAPRRRTNSDKRGGDTVYWNPSSDLKCGKAYDKGAHLRYQLKKGNIQVGDDILQLGENLLRLELKLGSRWFRRLEKDWRTLSYDDLATEHYNFFSSLIGGADVEVSDMGTLLIELERVAPSKGQALAAHRTWALMKSIGYTQTKESMPRATFARHCQSLRAAGISSADLCAGVIIPFRRRSLVLGQPVTAWDQIRRAA